MTATSDYLNRPVRTIAEAEQAIFARLTAAGYVIVPSIPTQEMRNAAFAAINRGQKGTIGIYGAMIAAAPEVTK